MFFCLSLFFFKFIEIDHDIQNSVVLACLVSFSYFKYRHMDSFIIWINSLNFFSSPNLILIAFSDCVDFGGGWAKPGDAQEFLLSLNSGTNADGAWWGC